MASDFIKSISDTGDDVALSTGTGSGDLPWELSGDQRLTVGLCTCSRTASNSMRASCIFSQQSSTVCIS